MEYDEILEAINANDIAKLQQIVTANKIDINVDFVSFCVATYYNIAMMLASYISMYILTNMYYFDISCTGMDSIACCSLV